MLSMTIQPASLNPKQKSRIYLLTVTDLLIHKSVTIICNQSALCGWMSMKWNSVELIQVKIDHIAKEMATRNCPDCDSMEKQTVML